MLIERKVKKDENEIVEYIECVYKSSNILHTVYFPSTERLYIAFDRGNMYSYEKITPIKYYDFETSDSQGLFFNKFINKKHEYRREYTLLPSELDDFKKIVENYNNNNKNNLNDE